MTASIWNPAPTDLETLTICDSIAELREIVGIERVRRAMFTVFVSGYYTRGDGGGGYYYLDPADTTSADDGGAIIVADDGYRWKLIVYGRSVTVEQFGAHGSASIDDIIQFRNCFNYIKTRSYEMHLSPRKTYRLSGGFGTDRSDETDFATGVKIFGNNATLLIDADALPSPGDPGYVSRFESSTTVINLEGNDVGVYDVRFASTRTINHLADPELYRDPLIIGIVIGGKSKGIWDTTLSNINHYKVGATVRNCQFDSINSPIIAMHVSDAHIERNVGREWTETGIVLRDIGTDVYVEDRNDFQGGADDCLFALHYEASPYGLISKYAGRIYIRNNLFMKTFAKCIGFGGYSDVHIHDNYTDLSAGGNIVGEIGAPWANNSRIYNDNIFIHHNHVFRGGRYYHSSYPYAPHQAPIAGEEHGIHFLRNAGRASYPIPFRNVHVHNNHIENPRAFACAYKGMDYVFDYDNVCISDVYDHGAGSVGPSGQPIWSDDIRTLSVRRDKFLTKSVSTWSNTYHFGNTNIVAGEITVLANEDYTGLKESLDGSAGTATLAQIRFNHILSDFTTAERDARMGNNGDALFNTTTGKVQVREAGAFTNVI